MLNGTPASKKIEITSQWRVATEHPSAASSVGARQTIASRTSQRLLTNGLSNLRSARFIKSVLDLTAAPTGIVEKCRAPTQHAWRDKDRRHGGASCSPQISPRVHRIAT